VSTSRVPPITAIIEAVPKREATSGGPAPILLTPEEAATALRIGRTRLYALLADRTIASVRIGHSRRITVSALQEFVSSLEHPWPPSGEDGTSTPDGHQGVAPERHDGQRPSHRSRRRRLPATTAVELLPLPFTVDQEEP